MVWSEQDVSSWMNVGVHHLATIKPDSACPNAKLKAISTAGDHLSAE